MLSRLSLPHPGVSVKQEETGTVELDLSGWNETAHECSGLETPNRLPPELDASPPMRFSLGGFITP
jgi:hypothetical protein